MSSVSAACIFGAYSASSAHTDTFYIVSQIVRVRNSKRHFFSKLTFPYIIQPLCFTLRQHRPQPLRFTLRQHRPQPPRFHPTATSTTTALLHPTATSTTTAPLHPTATSTTAAPLHPTATSTITTLLLPYGHIDHSRLAFTLRPHRPQPLRFTLRSHRPQPPRFTLRSHRPQPVISHNKAVLTALPKIFRIFLKKPLTNTRKPCIMFTVIWVWRRLVARYLGVVEAAGSNPVTQTS